MEYIIPAEQVKESNLIFKHAVKNRNTKYSSYYKLIYSCSDFNLKYIVLNIDSNNCGTTKKTLDSVVCELCKIEENILKSINNSLKKNIILNMSKELKAKSKLCISQQRRFVYTHVKISGVWESDNEIGLVYKFYYNISTEK